MQSKSIPFVLLVLFASLTLHATPRDVAAIANPRPNGNWIVDEADLLDTQAEAALNQSLSQLERDATIEFTLVLLNSIGDAVPKAFATNLFNSWHVGKKQNDNGLLLLLVMDQHRLEIETGYGLEGVLPDVVASRILHEVMVPQIRSGHAREGLVSGVQDIIQILSGDKARAEAYASGAALVRPIVPDLLWIVLAPGVLLITVYLVRTAALLFKSTDPFLTFAKLSGIWVCAALGGCVLVFIFLVFWLESVAKSPIFATLALLFAAVLFWFQLRLKKFLRYKKRICSECGKPMQLLSESEDDALLERKELFEETIESMNYDVWVCTPCKSHRVDGFNGNYASKFSKCLACGTKADKLICDIVKIQATTSASGLGAKVFECLFCHKKRNEQYEIAQISKSSSSGSSSFSGSSSSRGGGSFGGGSSGGGGAGASW